MKWIMPHIESSLIRSIQNNLDIHSAFARVLINRGVEDPEKAKAYLFEPFLLLNDPFLFSQMERAVERIIMAKNKGEKVLIYGDYDADGITASALLYMFLKEMGLDVEVFIPHRIIDGYSLNLDSIKAIDFPFSLLISVDCGISSIYEVAALKKDNIDVIITDHHEPFSLIPCADAIINPKLDDGYPFKGLSGVGVVLKLVEAVSIRLGGDSLRKEALKRFLPLVAVGTIADVMELKEENRFFVKYGLKLMESFPPFSALLEVSGISGRGVKPKDVSFIIAPRLNAPGRVSHALLSFELLTSENKERIFELARKINRENAKRQREEEKVFEEALTKVAPDEPVVFVWDENWHPGLIGIVASKLANHFNKPAFVVSFNGNDIGKGSGRSYGLIDVYTLLKMAKDYLHSWGGHRMAVGFGVRSGEVERVKDIICEGASQLPIEEKTYLLDAVLSFEDLDIPFVRTLLKLNPFGEGFEEPLFLFKDVRVKYLRAFSNRGLGFLAIRDGIGIDAYSFDVPLEKLKEEGVFDIVASVELDEWKDVKKLRLNVKDVNEKR